MTNPDGRPSHQGGQARGDQSRGTKTQASRNWLNRQTRDPIEHAILGSFDLAYALRHPIKSSAWAFGLGMSTLMLISIILGAFHLAFGKPGAVAFDWQKPTTWVSGGVDVIRRPIAGLLGATSERLGTGTGESGYDPDSFKE